MTRDVFLPISARQDDLLTNGRVIFGVTLTYSCRLATLQVEYLSVISRFRGKLSATFCNQLIKYIKTAQFYTKKPIIDVLHCVKGS
jgi:hypothetical protein